MAEIETPLEAYCEAAVEFAQAVSSLQVPETQGKLFGLAVTLGRCQRAGVTIPTKLRIRLTPQLLRVLLPIFTSAAKDVEARGIHSLVDMVTRDVYPVITNVEPGAEMHWPALAFSGDADGNLGMDDAEIIVGITATLTVERALQLWYTHVAVEAAMADLRDDAELAKLASMWEEGRNAFRDMDAAMRGEAGVLTAAVPYVRLDEHRRYVTGADAHWLLRGTLEALIEQGDQVMVEFRRRIGLDQSPAE